MLQKRYKRTINFSLFLDLISEKKNQF